MFLAQHAVPGLYTWHLYTTRSVTVCIEPNYHCPGAIRTVPVHNQVCYSMYPSALCCARLYTRRLQTTSCIITSLTSAAHCSMAIHTTPTYNQVCTSIYTTCLPLWYGYVVVCTDLWGKELYRQAGVGIVMTSGKPMWYNSSTLARNARDVGPSPVLGTVFPIFHHTHDTYIHDTYIQPGL